MNENKDNPTPKLSIIRLEELRGTWLNTLQLSQLSVDIYTSATKQFLVWLKENNIEKIGNDEILKYKEHLSEESSKKPTTVKLYIVAVRQFFKWMEAEKHTENMARNVHVPKTEELSKRDYLTQEQVKAVLDKIPRVKEADLRDYAMLLLMVVCGLRRIEICRADAEDFREEGGGRRLYIQGAGKTGKDDYIDIPKPIEQAVLEYLSVRNKRLTLSRRPSPGPPTPLFTSISNNSAGERVSVRCVTGIVKQRLRDAGFKNDRQCTHCLRQTAVSLAILAGRPLQEVQRFARHTTIATTMLYAKDTDNNKTGADACVQAVAGEIFG